MNKYPTININLAGLDDLGTLTTEEKAEYKRELDEAQHHRDCLTVGAEKGAALAEFRAQKNREYADAIAKPKFGALLHALVNGMTGWGMRNGLPLEAVKPVTPAVWTSDGKLVIEFERDWEVEL